MSSFNPLQYSDVVEWRAAHYSALSSVEDSQAFMQVLDRFPWGGSSMNWKEVPSVTFDIPWDQSSHVDRILAFVSSIPLGNHSHLMILYGALMPCLIVDLREGLRDIDLLWVPPEPIYFCGIDFLDGNAVPDYEWFGEFRVRSIRFRLI